MALIFILTTSNKYELQQTLTATGHICMGMSYKQSSLPFRAHKIYVYAIELIMHEACPHNSQFSTLKNSLHLFDVQSYNQPSQSMLSVPRRKKKAEQLFYTIS